MAHLKLLITRRGEMADAEGGGLLIQPALFVHTAFHVF
jgi:hypothetical protein